MSDTGTVSDSDRLSLDSGGWFGPRLGDLEVEVNAAFVRRINIYITFQNEIGLQSLHAEGGIIHFIENCPKTRCTNQLNINMHPR